MEIKDILKSRRLELDLTMKEVADIVGVSEGTISRWESGEIANMRRDKIAALAKVLRISPSIIMGWEEPKEKETALRPDETDLLTSYNKLNDAGKVKAREAVDDLTENFKYALDPPALLAAHARTDVAPDPEGEAEDISIILQMAESHKSDANND